MASPPAQACVFCGIIAGQLPASLVHEGEHVVAFMDVRPLTPGHLLVVPRVHADSLHVIPRTPGDGFRLKARSRTPGRDELDATAERVTVNDCPGAAAAAGKPGTARAQSKHLTPPAPIRNLNADIPPASR